MFVVEMGGLGVVGRIAQRNQRDGNIILGKIQLLLQRLVVETAHPAGAEALFGGFQLDVVDDDEVILEDGATLLMGATVLTFTSKPFQHV